MGKFKTFEDMKHNIPKGATHYQDESEEFMFAWFNANEDKCYVMGEWKYCSMKDYPDGEIKPIPQKPPTRTEYEKVAESIFDLRDEFECGELYFNADTDGEYHKIQAIKVLGLHFDKGNLYRVVEKEVDWRDEVYDYLGDCQWFDCNTSIGNALMSEHASSAFIELCRVALRANGEID